jgi:hypothetical protein
VGDASTARVGHNRGMALTDPLLLLKRTDKWYLGNGGMLVYAPPFPQHLHVPGFWDECHFGDLAVPNLLCVSVAMEVGADGVRPEPEGQPPAAPTRALLPLDPYFSYWHWQPDEIRARYYLVEREGRGYKQQAGLRIFMEESRRLGPDGTLHCGLRFEPMADCPPTRLHVVAWTMRQRPKGANPPATYSDFFSDGHALTYKQNFTTRANGQAATKPQTLQVTFSADREPDSLEATPAHSASLTPRLELTPLWDSLRRGLGQPGGPTLRGEVSGGNVLGTMVYAGLHWRVDVAGKKFEVGAEVAPPGDGATGEGGASSAPTVLQSRAPCELCIRVNVRDPRDGSRPAPGQTLAGRGGSVTRPVLPAKTKSGRVTDPPLQKNSSYFLSLNTPDPTQAWREFLSLVPHFECSDPMFTRYYWYRWYGLRLNAVPAGGNFSHPAVCEGIGGFRGVISYSLMCHLHECKWLADPALAAGCLRNHLTHQARPGFLAGHVFLTQVSQRGTYHTDLGGSVRALLAHHPDAALQDELRPALTRVLEYHLGQRDREGLALYDLWDQYETGQEFNSRYFHADPRADLYGWEHKLRLKGVDVTAYAYHLAQLLRDWALARGDVKESQRLSQACELTKIAVRQFMWGEEQQFFFDYSAAKKEASPYWAGTGFYPLLSDLATDEMAGAVGAHLLPQFLGGTGKFDTPWPTPTSPPDDPYFSADPAWRGERANCPWNGRVWPMLNSHMVEVLGRLCSVRAELAPPSGKNEGRAEQAPPLQGSATYRSHLAWYLKRWIELMHFEKLSGQPGAEHGHGEKDYTRPNCFEHYHPYDGTASEYRGIDDYMHSWVADALLKHVCGVKVISGVGSLPPTDSIEDGRQAAAPTRLVVDPLDFDLTNLLLLNCRFAGRRLDLTLNRDLAGKHVDAADGQHGGWRVYLDGELVHRAEQPERWEGEL